MAAWRDRWRQRAARLSGGKGAPAAPAGPDRSTTGGAAQADPSGPDGAGNSSAVPGDWDGGWRRTSAPALTVSRRPLGVSDGLVFRAGLASWQNPSLGGTLGHAVLPTAPTGLVRGVTRPAEPSASGGGSGPLLLRAVRTQGDSAGDAEGPSAPGPAAVRPSSRPRGGTAARGGRAPDAGSPGSPAPRTPTGRGSGEGAGSTGSPAARTAAAPPSARQTAGSPVVAPARGDHSARVVQVPLVRRVSVVRPPVTPGPAVQRTSTEAAGRTGAGEAPRGVGAARVVRPRAVRPALTVARRPAGPVRTVPALRPTAGEATGVRSAAAPGQAGAPTGARSAGESSPPSPAAPAGRAPLGAPLGELPFTARQFTTDAARQPTPSDPLLPVAVQRRAEGAGTDLAAGASGPVTEPSAPSVPSASVAPSWRDTPGDRSGARARGGLGAPLPSMPPTADVPASGPPGSPVSRPTAGPGGSTGAPLLGRGDVQRAVTEGPFAGGGATASGAEGPGPTGPATPLVRPSHRTAPAGTTTGDRPTGSAHRTGAPTGTAPDSPRTGGVGPERQRPEHRASVPGPVITTGEHSASPAGPRTAAPTGSGAAPGGHRGPSRAPGPISPAADGVGVRPPAPGIPLVVARSVASAATDSRTSGRGPHAATGDGSTGPVAHRPGATPGGTVTGPVLTAASLPLLPARPLTLSTRVPEGLAPPATPARAGGGLVVPARWPGTPAPAPEGQASPHGSPGTPVQRAAAAHPGGGEHGVRAGALAAPSALHAPTGRAIRDHARSPGHPAPPAAVPAPDARSAAPRAAVVTPAPRVPVVMPAPARPEATAAQAGSLPVSPPGTPPATGGPSTPQAQAGPVALVRPRAVVTAQPPAGGAGAALPVQRAPSPAGDLAVAKGTPAKAAPAKDRSRTASPAGDLAVAAGRPGTPARGTSSSSSSSSSSKGASRADDPRDPGLDLDDLARRLLDPVARLLRTELRRGRERTGRPYDGRR